MKPEKQKQPHTQEFDQIKQINKELKSEISQVSFNPRQRNEQYISVVSKNPKEKSQAKKAKLTWKQNARNLYGNEWKRLTRLNGYSV